MEFAGGFHLDGYINGNVTGNWAAGTVLSVSEQGCVEGSVVAPNVLLNGTVKGDIDAKDRVELGSKARVLGNVHYTVIETAVGAQINGKLIHREAPGGPEARSRSAIEALMALIGRDSKGKLSYEHYFRIHLPTPIWPQQPANCWFSQTPLPARWVS